MSRKSDLGSAAMPSGCDELARRAICAWQACNAVSGAADLPRRRADHATARRERAAQDCCKIVIARSKATKQSRIVFVAPGLLRWRSQ